MKLHRPFPSDLKGPFLVALVCQFVGSAIHRGAKVSPSVSIFDRSCVAALNPDAAGPLDWALIAIDRYGPTGLQALAALFVAAIFVAPRLSAARTAAAGWALGGALAQAAANVLKTVVRRERPLEAGLEGWALREILPVPDVARSFPSGHVTTATIVATGAWIVLRRLGVPLRARAPLAALPLVMAWDRVALALHHPSDAFAGMTLGLAGTALGVFAVDLVGALFKAPPPRAPIGRRGVVLVTIVGAVLVFLPTRDVVGRDPATGAVVEGFRLKRPGVGGAAPASGPALFLARVGDLRGFAKRGAAAYGALLVLLVAYRAKTGRGGALLYVAALLPPIWIGQFASGARRPAAFRAEGDGGVFVDWHLHPGDRADGRFSHERCDKRQKARGVSWAITTRHDDRPADPGDLSHGVYGVEWSGGDYPRSKTAHVLILGDAHAVDAAIAAKTELEAVRIAKERGALVIVAHHWRSAAIYDGAPSAEAFADAGADGFEIGNRMFDARPERREAVRELDAFCRRRGLLRFSFSDDHGVPSGSGAATYLDGVTRDDLKRGGPTFAASYLSRLRRDAPADVRIDAASVVPLMFDDANPNDALDAALPAPLRYAATTTRGERLEWLAFALLVYLSARRLRSGAAK